MGAVSCAPCRSKPFAPPHVSKVATRDCYLEPFLQVRQTPENIKFFSIQQFPWSRSAALTGTSTLNHGVRNPQRSRQYDCPYSAEHSCQQCPNLISRSGSQCGKHC